MTAIQEDDVHFLQRRQRFLRMDVHPTAPAITVHYAVEASMLGDAGDYVMGDRKVFQKTISVKSLRVDSNLLALTETIMVNCRMIPPVKTPEITQLLKFLQKRHKDDPMESSQPAVGDSAAGRGKEFGEGFMQEPFEDGKKEQPAHIEEIEDYIELLYEEGDQKIKATGLILQLCRNPDNLEELLENETLLSALARVMREEWKRDTQLAINITYCFFCFSTYTNFHGVIAQYKVGALLLEAVAFELVRYKQWMKLLEDKMKKLLFPLRASAKDAGAVSPDDAGAFSKLQGQVQTQVRLQDKFLRVSLYLLLNLAEDMHTESKMVKKDLIKYLLALLERNNIELLILVMSFIKKLSVVRQNKDFLVSKGIVKKIARLFECNHEVVINMAVRTLTNLSFDPAVCQRVVKARLLQKIIPLLDIGGSQSNALYLLYHISINHRHKNLFAYLECVPKLVQLIAESPGSHVSTELGALCVNLALYPRNAELMCGVAEDDKTLTGHGLKILLKRALRNQDPLLLKVLRNISVHPQSSIRQLFVPFVPDIGRVMMTCVDEDQEFLCDLIGLLSNLTFGQPVRKAKEPSEDGEVGRAEAEIRAVQDDVPEECYQCLRCLITDCSALDIISAKLSARVVAIQLSSDAGWVGALEPMLLCVAMAHDDECALAMAHSSIIDLVAARLNGQQDDDEIVVQTTYFFYLMLLHVKTRHYCILDTQIPHILVELMHDPNKEVKKICNAALDIVQEEDPQWAASIQESRFINYNSAWLDQAQQNAIHEEINVAEERMFNGQMNPMEFQAGDVYAQNFGAMYGEAVIAQEEDEEPVIGYEWESDGEPDRPMINTSAPTGSPENGDDTFQDGTLQYSYSQQAELLGQSDWGQPGQW